MIPSVYTKSFRSYLLHFSECNHSYCKTCTACRSSTLARTRTLGTCQATDWTNVWIKASSRTVALLIVMDIPATSWGMHASSWPWGPLTLPHSHCSIDVYQYICTANFMHPMLLHSCSCIHSKLNLYRDACIMPPLSCGPIVPLHLRCTSYASFIQQI